MMGKRFRILLVDWELGYAEQTATLLDAEGFYVRICSQPRVALRYIRQAPFWLYIMNPSLPGMEGVDFVRRLRRLRPFAPILVMSNGLSPEESDRFRAQGVEMQLRKSIRPELFLDVIRALSRIGRSIAPMTQVDQPGLPATGPKQLRPSMPPVQFKPPASA